MTPIATTLVLVSAFAHAGWNYVSKRRDPAPAFFLVTSLASAVCLLPVQVVYRRVWAAAPAGLWLLVAATGLSQAVYYVGLAGAYRSGDLSLVYPLARAIPVLSVVGVNLLLGRGAQIGALGLAGMLLVVVGCLMLPLPDFRKLTLRSYATRACAFALLAALGTTGYTVIDDEVQRQLRTLDAVGLGATESTLLFMALQSMSTAACLMLFRLPAASGRRSLQRLIERGLWTPVITGLVITATYGLVLASMAYVSNVSYVAAFRQLSIPLGALMGIAGQGERAPAPKVLGIGVVVVGLVFVALG